MKAAPQDQEKLLQLQEVDNRLLGNEKRVREAQIEKPGASEQAQLTALSPLYLTLCGERDDAQSDLKRIEDDTAVVLARIEADNVRLQNSTNSKEAIGLGHELVTLAARQEELEAAQLDLLSVIETKEQAITQIVEQREALSLLVSQADDARETVLTALASERTQILAERVRVVAGIPEDLVTLYEKQRERYGVGAGLLQRGVSGGNGMALGAQELDVIRHTEADEVVICPVSSCILVRTSESGL